MTRPTATELLITKLRYDVCDKLESCEPCKGLRQDSIKALEQSRALVTELRALAEEISSIQKSHRAYGDFSQGQKDARGYWLERIEALIAAHDAQQAHREPKS